MVVILLIFLIALGPAMVSAWISYRYRQPTIEPVRLEPPSASNLQTMLQGDRGLHYVEGAGYIIGDATCQLNARSPYLRCAVNPSGPCDGCSSYQSQPADPTPIPVFNHCSCR
ncbi:hypothetical protein XM38_049220 [Halomicronema hongdechloris C2206]|uniref:Uncharacterized protein n=1 Tax=Halomicronema hongdechloris C2206 TaxID=1641165 RepID=A0A1Z3HUF4_9CYAN|nr:DUF6464 family protein [Halomicronema hongdechloris]ASC73948.1 hypothetical protein XM38_049220 [Halomicronema hongdechloris C2206]